MVPAWIPNKFLPVPKSYVDPPQWEYGQAQQASFTALFFTTLTPDPVLSKNASQNKRFVDIRMAESFMGWNSILTRGLQWLVNLYLLGIKNQLIYWYSDVYDYRRPGYRQFLIKFGYKWSWKAVETTLWRVLSRLKYICLCQTSVYIISKLSFYLVRHPDF